MASILGLPVTVRVTVRQGYWGSRWTRRLSPKPPAATHRICGDGLDNETEAGSADDEDGFHFAVAPYRFDGERMGFLIAGAPMTTRFDALKLKMLAGLADQAKLAIASAPGS